MAHFLKCSLLGHCQHFFIVSLETGWYFSAASARLMHFFVFVSQISVAELHFVQISLLSMPWDALVGHSIHLLDEALSNAIFPSFAPHGATHSPLRLNYHIWKGQISLINKISALIINISTYLLLFQCFSLL